MSKLSKLSLAELYALKVTPAVAREITSKEDFSKISNDYCTKVCKLKCKTGISKAGGNILPPPSKGSEVDILIVQDHLAPKGKFDRTKTAQEDLTRKVIDHLCLSPAFDGLTVRITQLLKCPPNETDFYNGRAPVQTTLLKCAPYLHHEIRQLKPKVIISLGTASTKALKLEKQSNTRNRGEFFNSEFGPVVITLHPKILSMIRQNAQGSGGMWGADLYTVIQRDFEKAARIAKGTLKIQDRKTVVEEYRKTIHFVKTIDEVKQVMDKLNHLPADSYVSFDTETTGLDPFSPTMRLLTIQFGWRDPLTNELKVAVIPLWHRKNTYYSADEAWELIAPFLTGPAKKIGHNAKYDILVIYATKKVRVANVKYDTMLMLHSINSGCQGTYGLKAATWDWIPELGFAGYEDLLGSLAELEKKRDAEVGSSEEDVGGDE